MLGSALLWPFFSFLSTPYFFMFQGISFTACKIFMGLLWPLKSLMTFFSPLWLSLILLAYLEEDEILMMSSNFLTLQYFPFSCYAFYVVVFLWSLYFWYGIQWFQICLKNRIMWSQRKNELKHSLQNSPKLAVEMGHF